MSDNQASATREPEKRRASFLSVSEQYNLNTACQVLAAVGYGTFHVGSSLTRKDYRDVDLRCLIPDDEFDAMLGGNARLKKLVEVAISEWVANRTDLPIDFQFQKSSAANIEFKGPRNGIGLI